MNQKGEVSLLCIFMVVALSSLLTLCTLELHKSFSLLKKRTHLFLCVKETKGELHQFLKFMGRTNYAISKSDDVKWLTTFIPGLQGVASSADKAKKVLYGMQELNFLNYLKALTLIKKKDCPMDPRMWVTPYVHSLVFQRTPKGMAKLRSNQWTYTYLRLPYSLSLKIDASKSQQMRPQIIFESWESVGKLSSLLSSR